jgi:hypothetical protein
MRPCSFDVGHELGAKAVWYKSLDLSLPPSLPHVLVVVENKLQVFFCAHELEVVSPALLPKFATHEGAWRIPHAWILQRPAQRKKTSSSKASVNKPPSIYA